MVSSESERSVFELAVNYLNSTKPTLNQQTQLKLYALYKIATVSLLPPTDRPGIWNLRERAKWDSWSQLGSSPAFPRDNDDDAQQRAKEMYVEAVKNLGWRNEELGSSSSRENRDDAPTKNQQGMVNVSSMLTEELGGESSLSTPLHNLAIEGPVDELRTHLLQAEKDNKLGIDSRDSYGFTALHLAADRGRREAVKVLLEFGADKSLMEREGETAESLAVAGGHDEIVALLK